ncbi:hypothetical protein [Simiduia agarivorans]|uniref:Lipase modulator n=1 Tax=Simiduia agarivorans (strain DSM 21679 / JCM 13881 / BCRC 17597 / SA1) TaxID=1117647 RepID=K4KK01_SIMAS|nr:hypothetical protein [Simiduia agarivorans]AFU98353.2 hypothetical protein M5M_05740 [Simiduia agarivorans SA1 = DSM 21679]
MKMKQPLIIATTCMAAGGLLFWSFSSDAPQPSTSATPPAGFGNAYPGGTTRATPQSLEQEPEVAAYLQREAQKQQLQAYFADTGDMDAEEAWALIETLEQQQRVLGFEALHLKLAWLEKQHDNRDDFEAAAKALMEDYRQRAASQAPYRPEDIPGYTDYKARELAIIEHVNGMHSFPNGMSREEYLRQQLLEARMEAYGEKR